MVTPSTVLAVKWASTQAVMAVPRHVFLELGQSGCRVGAVEPTDGHHRIVGGQLIAGGALRSDSGGHPRVMAGLRLEELGQGGARRAGVQDTYARGDGWCPTAGACRGWPAAGCGPWGRTEPATGRCLFAGGRASRGRRATGLGPDTGGPGGAGETAAPARTETAGATGSDRGATGCGSG